ncbi:MAG: NRDE family protein, partial [Balneolaceae bacterium]|nr:NRDE family protein [Balneolaceae bacterium]
MCLILFSYKNHSRFDLIFAANRDEFYQRPTRAARFWDDHPDVLAGKDLAAGGTWLGINRSGRFAALTNYRDPSIVKK